MSAAKGGGKKQAKRRGIRSRKDESDVDSKLLALPEDEVCRLVLRIICRDDIEPFVRRMVVLIDSLRAGRTGRVAQIARQSKDPAFVTLMTAMSEVVGEGRTLAAYHTAFYAASCAYRESLDYVCRLMDYLDTFRRRAGRALKKPLS